MKRREPLFADVRPAASAGLGPRLYVAWAALSIGVSFALAGANAESFTRLGVLLFLLVQLLFRERLGSLLPRIRPGARFVLLGTGLAAVVEGLHMVSTPVFLSLRVTRETPALEALRRYGLDLLLTLPAYLVVFSVIWAFVARYDWPLWRYVLVVGLAQTFGDGGAFYFWGAPAMLAFLPYPMSNYHAVNVLPFLAVRGSLPPGRVFGRRAYLVLPAVVATYFVCGATIRVVGTSLGLGAGLGAEAGHDAVKLSSAASARAGGPGLRPTAEVAQLGRPAAASANAAQEAPGSFPDAPLTREIAIESRRVPLAHSDPADRFTAATAVVNGLTLVTADERLLGVPGLPPLANR